MQVIEEIEAAAMPITRVANSAVVEATASQQAAGEFLIFRLGKEEYGIDILCVQEIRSYEAPTQMANTPDFIKGLINLRGIIVPILDLRQKFSMECKYDDSTVVIVLCLAQHTVGVVVDAVSDVLVIDSSAIRPPPQFAGATDVSWVRGIGTISEADRNRMLILIDIELLLAPTEVDLSSISEFSHAKA